MSGYYLGIDIGGTKVAVGLVSESGEVLRRRRVSTASLRAGSTPVAAMLQLGRDLVAEEGGRLLGVGAALPGPVAPGTSTLLACPTFPELQGVEMAALLEEAFQCPARGENDGTACALAEARLGAGRGHAVVAYMTISTGIGGGIVAFGAIWGGATGTAAEFGHQLVAFGDEARECDCGGAGCLQAMASGSAIAHRAQSAWGEPDITAVQVGERVRRGDPAAQQLWEETIVYLARGASNIANLLDPTVLVLGGGVALGMADLLLPRLRAETARLSMPRLARGMAIEVAGLGEELGVVSAAVLAMPGNDTHA